MNKILCVGIMIISMVILTGCQSTVIEGEHEYTIYDNVEVIGTEHTPAKNKSDFKNNEVENVEDAPEEFKTILSYSGFVIDDRSEEVYKLVKSRDNENYVKMRLKIKEVDGEITSIKVHTLE